MNIELQPSQSLRLLLATLGTALLILSLQAMATLLNPILIGLVLAMICIPAIDWLRRKNVPTVLAVILVIVGLLVIGLLFVGIVGLSMGQISEKLPVYQARLEQIQTNSAAWLAGLGIPVSTEAIEASPVGGRSIIQLISFLLGAVGKVVAQSLLILGITVFAIIESLLLSAKIETSSLKNSHLATQTTNFMGSIQNYLVLKTWISLMTGAVVLVFLLVMRIDFALLWALLAVILNYIPSIGSILASIPAIFIALMQYDLQTAVIIGLGYWIINYAIGWGIEPRVMGRGLNLSILTVFLSLIVWAWILGPVGMFMSLPLTVLLKYILESFDDTRWLALLLSDRPPDATGTRV
ncbi:MAG: AI-2E family transporter [Anaerolineae bacterium]|nr:AI-2E family transporter [Anaerolineae bacterium]